MKAAFKPNCSNFEAMPSMQAKPCFKLVSIQTSLNQPSDFIACVDEAGDRGSMRLVCRELGSENKTPREIPRRSADRVSPVLRPRLSRNTMNVNGYQVVAVGSP